VARSFLGFVTPFLPARLLAACLSRPRRSTAPRGVHSKTPAAPAVAARPTPPVSYLVFSVAASGRTVGGRVGQSLGPTQGAWCFSIFLFFHTRHTSDPFRGDFGSAIVVLIHLPRSLLFWMVFFAYNKRGDRYGRHGVLGRMIDRFDFSFPLFRRDTGVILFVGRRRHRRVASWSRPFSPGVLPFLGRDLEGEGHTGYTHYTLGRLLHAAMLLWMHGIPGRTAGRGPGGSVGWILELVVWSAC